MKIRDNKNDYFKIVQKKILPEYFEAIVDGRKTFELRKDEDDIQVGDMLNLLEWDGEKFTGRQWMCLITYVLRNCPEWGLMEGYCILGLE